VQKLLPKEVPSDDVSIPPPDSEQTAEFARILNNPPEPNGELKKLMKSKPIWER
jgi:Protein of unknown function (DUF1778)